MTTKAQEAPVLYDAGAKQIIPFTLPKNGKQYPVTYTVNPLTNEQYFKLELAAKRAASRLKTLSTDIYKPKEDLFSEVAVERSGYKDKSVEKTKPYDRSAVINAILQTQVIDEAETDVADESELFDDEALTAVQFRALFEGTLMTITHSFRQETAAEMDEFLAIEAEQPNPAKLASAKAMSKAEKLFSLGEKLITQTDGYAPDSPIPAWHIAATTESYFLRQLGRMGKSSPE